MRSARFTRSVSLPVSLVSVLLLVSACAASSKGDVAGADAGTSGPDAGGADAASPDASSDAAPAADSGALPLAGECSGEVTQTACATCCTTKHQDGAAVYFVALIDCMCVDANCADPCKETLCDPDAPKNADAKCQACVQDKNGACASTIKTACTADPLCVAFDKCIGASDCLGKTN